MASLARAVGRRDPSRRASWPLARLAGLVVHTARRCNEQVGREGDEEAVFDDAGALVEQGGDPLAVVDGAEVAVVDPVPLVGYEWAVVAATHRDGRAE